MCVGVYTYYVYEYVIHIAILEYVQQNSEITAKYIWDI